jgi:hypothetical protein
MTQPNSAIAWIAQLKVGKPQAAQPLWERYVDRLARLARRRLGETSRRAAAEEDLAISTFNGFFRGAKNHDLHNSTIIMTSGKFW